MLLEAQYQRAASFQGTATMKRMSSLSLPPTGKKIEEENNLYKK
jgi:hypothetical protein